MYINENDKQGNQHINKGEAGERLFQEWCIDNNIPFKRATNEQDYKFKVDYFIEIDGVTRAVDVKNNYSVKYDTFVVEIEQLEEGKPDAWLNHTWIDYIAFILKRRILLISMEKLRKIKYYKYRHLDRKQWPSKGTPRIVFIPRTIMEALV